MKNKIHVLEDVMPSQSKDVPIVNIRSSIRFSYENWIMRFADLNVLHGPVITNGLTQS